MEEITYNNLPEAITRLHEKMDRIERLLLEKVEQRPHESADGLLNINQAAEFLHLSKATIYSMVSNRQLPHMKRSGRLYFSTEELKEYVRAGKRKTMKEIEEEAHLYITSRNRRKR